MSVDSKNLELLKKLKELAEHGVGGEKDNAQRLLEKLMKKYGVEKEDLSDDTLENHDFRYHNEYEMKLLNQVMYKVATGRRRYHYKFGKGSRTTYGCTCTKAEALRIQIEYEFYLALLKEEQEMFFFAFIQKHRIFDTKAVATTKLDEETERRMRAMMNGMQDKSLNPMLEEGDI